RRRGVDGNSPRRQRHSSDCRPHVRSIAGAGCVGSKSQSEHWALENSLRAAVGHLCNSDYRGRFRSQFERSGTNCRSDRQLAYQANQGTGGSMRTTIIALMLAIAFVRPSGAQQRKSDIEREGFKGKVKTIKVDDARLSSKSGKPVEGKRVQIETQTYGENGMLVKSVRLTDDGRLTNYFYSYDSNGS